MWCNVRAAVLNAMLQFLVIYRFVGTFYAFGLRLFVEGKRVGPDSFSVEFFQNPFVYKTRHSKKRETSNIYGTEEMNVNPNNLSVVRHRVIQP